MDLNKSYSLVFPFEEVIEILRMEEYSVKSSKTTEDNRVSAHAWRSIVFLTSPFITTLKIAGETKTDIVLTFGSLSRLIKKGAEENGAESYSFNDKSELTSFLKSILKENDTVLFKGSRSMKMEEIFHELYKEWEVWIYI